MQAGLYYLAFVFFSALTAGLTALIALTRQAHSGRRPLVLALCACGWWAFFEGLLFLGRDLETKLLLTRMQYLGVVSVPPFIFYYVLEYLGYITRRRTGVALILGIVPVITLALVWTNDLHRLIWLDYDAAPLNGISVLELTHGPFFWVYVAYNYLLLGAAGVLVLRAFLRARALFRLQFAVILAALLLPLLGNVVYVTGVATERPFDFTPIAFSVATLLIAAGFFYFKLQDVMPVAKDRIFRSIPDGIIVLDEHDRITFMNKADTLPVADTERYMGAHVSRLYAAFPRLDAVLRSHEKEVAITVGDPAGEREFDVRVSLLHDRHGATIGRLLLFRDITVRMRLEGELRRIATTDELTGLLNRREFLERAEREFSRSLRYGHPVAFLMMDVDNLKVINDTYGHAAGDEALRRMAGQAQGCVRETDIFGRLGGDEFAMLLLETRAPEAVELAERVRGIMDEVELEFETGTAQLTVSIGVAARGAETSLDELMSRADRSLYRAKRAGRDRVDAS